MKQAIATEQEERGNNPLRTHRRPGTVESPEAEPSSCHCRYGHRNFEACSADSRSPHFSPGLGEQACGSKYKPETRPSQANRTMEKKQSRSTGPRSNKRRKTEPEPVFGEEIPFRCDCGGGHDTELECEYALVLKKHVEISTSIVIGSQAMVTIIVGTEPQQSFHVQKELLTLFSGCFQDIFSRPAPVTVKEAIKTAEKTQSKPEVKQEFDQQLPEIPDVENIEIVYDLHQEKKDNYNDDSENMLKKFASHCLGANNPFERYKATSSEGRAWQQLLAKRNGMFLDAITADSNRWNAIKPWDDKLIGNYMVKEDDIEERWVMMIPAKSGKDVLKRAARAGDVGAKLELGHLAAEKRILGYDKWALGDSSDDEI